MWTCGGAEGYDGQRVAVHDRHYVGTYLVDITVDETLQVDGSTVSVQGRSIQLELDDVLGLHQSGCYG